MPDYKQMYFELFRATVQANHILQVAQQQAEQQYLACPEPPLVLHQKKQPPPQGE